MKCCWFFFYNEKLKRLLIFYFCRFLKYIFKVVKILVVMFLFVVFFCENFNFCEDMYLVYEEKVFWFLCC